MGGFAGMAATGASAAGSLLTGFSGYTQAHAQANQARLQAQMAARNADVATDAGLTNAQRDYQQGSQTLGSLRAQMAANGVALDAGSALDVQRSVGRTTGLNVGDTLYQANAQAVNYRNQATGLNNQARVDKARGTAALVGGGLKATSSTLLSTARPFADSVYDMLGIPRP